MKQSSIFCSAGLRGGIRLFNGTVSLWRGSKKDTYPFSVVAAALRRYVGARHCKPHSMWRGNPAFLQGYLPDCFLDYFIWIASHYLPVVPAPHGMGLAMTWKTFGNRCRVNNTTMNQQGRTLLKKLCLLLNVSVSAILGVGVFSVCYHIPGYRRWPQSDLIATVLDYASLAAALLGLCGFGLAIYYRSKLSCILGVVNLVLVIVWIVRVAEFLGHL